MNRQAKNALFKGGLVVGGMLVGTSMTGLLFVLGVTLVSTISHSIINPTEWTPAIPLIGAIATAVTVGGSLALIRSRHPFSDLAIGAIASALIFCGMVVVYYFGWAS